jgi:hypothetical protein
MENKIDSDGNPAGGFVIGVGLTVEWQNGPLGRGPERKAPNGAFVETLLSAVKQRIEWYQTVKDGKFACRENVIAITKIDEALLWLDKRTRDREARQVEGTHQK